MRVDIRERVTRGFQSHVTQWALPGHDVVRHVATDLNVHVVGQGADAVQGRPRGRFDLGRHQRLALYKSQTYGHMPFEQVFNIDTARITASVVPGACSVKRR